MCIHEEDVAKKVRVHIQPNDGPNDIYRITAEKYARESAAFADIASMLDVSFGTDDADADIGLASAEVLVCGYFGFSGLAARAPKLKWVQSIFAGVDKLIPAIPPGVTLTNASGVHAQKAGEYAMGAILMLNSAVPQFIEAQRKGAWTPIFTPSMTGRTVTILGAGRLAAAVAQHARHFGARVVGIARSSGPRTHFPEVYATEHLPEILPTTDFLILMVPNTAETKGLIGKKELDLLPPHAGIVSLGRSQVMDHDALVEKLERGELAGAFLDVFDKEPLPADSKLWTAPRLVISPHCALDDGPDYARLSLEMFISNMRLYLDSKPMINIVDTARGY
jgi:glyoxylate/hydroxypyruvate reductase A